MRDLMRDPLWRPEDLGRPIPDSPHAVSMALPLWRHVVGYEERDPAVIDRLACGYPRFVYHPRVAELFRHCERCFAGPGEMCVALPSRRVAEECAAFLGREGYARRVDRLDGSEVHAVTAPREAAAAAKTYWQHTGWVLSSRHAAAALDGARPDETAGAAARAMVRRRLASLYGAAPDDVALFPSGMAAIAAALRLARALRPGRRSIQLGFPYVDTLKVQQRFGPGAQLFPDAGEEGTASLKGLLEGEAVSAVVAEAPSNPLLRTADLPFVRDLLRRNGGLLIVDDTIGTPVNIDVTPCADVVVTSLTKYVSGTGDVFAGALVLIPGSPHRERLRAALAEGHEELLWWEDAVVLEERSRDFVDRMQRINATAAILAERLRAHPGVARIFYPQYDESGAFERLRRPGGGHGGLFSIVTRDAARTAEAVYDRLRVSKGPSLGTNFTLACPYTVLAHYGELDWAESCGVSRWLIRVSVGLEDAEDLWSRFADALGAAV